MEPETEDPRTKTTTDCKEMTVHLSSSLRDFREFITLSQEV